MSEESGGKKSVGGHFAVALAGLGALFARTADDCGRVAIKGGAAFGDDAIRGASRVGSLADDGLRGGAKLGSLADDGIRSGSKFGSLADDGLRAGKYGALADDGLRNGVRVAPHENPAGLIEEIGTSGAKAESHLGEVAESAVDVSLEVISNAPQSSDDDDDDSTAHVAGEVEDSVRPAKVEPLALLRARNKVSQPAFLPVLPASPTAFQRIFGRPDKTTEAAKFAAIHATPDIGQGVLDPLKWLKGRLTHNPITFVFYTTDATGRQTPIPLILPNGGTSTDTALHQACIEHYAHCILFICRPEKNGKGELCAKSVADTWQTVSAESMDMTVSAFLEKLVTQRAYTPALHDVAISRIDVSQDTPRIVRSRLKAKKSGN